ncbi:SpoIIE family protein phosphatase [Desulfococcaceae bacterium HSG9]|nr:SpoIIE family protein phosphatase [Desulfococcaceae bacterium HSG9]
MIAEWQYAGREIQGAREYQEDYYAFFDPFEGQKKRHDLVAALADGMGGYYGGAQAAQIAVNAFMEQFVHSTVSSIKYRLQESMEYANQRIQDAIKVNPQLAEMGCTFIGFYITYAGLEWISVGDSMLYLFRRGVLKRLNAEHTMARLFDERVRQGEMAADDAKRHPDRRMLSSALTAEPPALVDLSLAPLPLFPDDIIIAASDGLKTLSDKKMAHALQYAKTQNAAELAEHLIDMVEHPKNPIQDNTTVLTVYA